MQSSKISLKEQNLLKDVYRFAKMRKVKLYLVGGILRDILLGREKENLDFDFCIKKGAINFGRKLAKELKCGFVVLDNEHGACRLVKKSKGKICTLDFTDFRGATIEKDLLHRDFTINSMVLELKDVFSKGSLNDLIIDLYGAKQDLKNKIIRVVNKKSFSQDPLRILRAFSFSCMLGFKIDGSTLRLAKLEREKLAQVSGERIREELFKIFASDDAYKCFIELDNSKVLEVLFPEIKKMRDIGQGPYHHLDVWQHTLETVKQLEIVFEEHRKNIDIQAYLDEIISSERKRKALVKFGAFLHDIGKPKALRREDGKIKFHGHERIGLYIAEEIAKRLKLSNDEIFSLRKIVLSHLRPGYLADKEEPTERAKFRFFRDAGIEAISVLLLSLADQRATKGPLTTAKSRTQHEKVISSLIKEYYRKRKEKKLPRLINGDDLLKQFGLEPSPLIGKILSEVEELQAIGKIKTKEGALKIAKEFIKRRIK